MNDKSNWVFKDPPNMAVIADRKIVREQDWIAHVFHDADDGGWQFHNSDLDAPKLADALVVSLQEIAALDPSVAKLADLPLGWRAWPDSKGSDWQRLSILAPGRAQ